MKQLIEFRPVVEKINGGWQAKATMYENANIFTAVEIFNAYDDKQEAWDNAIKGAKQVVKKHNDSCRCGKKAVVGSY